ncbi:MAG: hypothetical protein S0880_12750 [Actinomycetota bacterium]|nr:hypothetical protein [Actinomycetota bacterium]
MTSPDPARLRERLARQLRQEGYPHPDAAAVALAARGSTGLGAAAFARAHGLDPDLVARAERGLVPLDELPVCVVALAPTA